MTNKSKKYFITGVAGTGKTTISRVLNVRGITAIDFASIPRLCYWRDKNSKERVVYSPDRDRTWLDAHESVCDTKRLEKLIDEHKGIVVITGIASGNLAELFSLFDKIFLLQCKPEILTHRLQTRDTSVFAKTEAVQKYVIEWQGTFDSQALSLGAIPVRTEGMINDVIERLVSQF